MDFSHSSRFQGSPFRLQWMLTLSWNFSCTQRSFLILDTGQEKFLCLFILCIFESLQLEDSHVGDLLYLLCWIVVSDLRCCY